MLQIVAAGSRSDERWMNIATFNINNINRRLPNLLDWLKASKPDVVCLQIAVDMRKVVPIGKSVGA